MPIISEENYIKTESIVKEFSKSGGIGEKLQELLYKIAEEKDNWVIKMFDL
jgi:carnitine O-acetyltransferase